jgi:hypothetical protein
MSNTPGYYCKKEGMKRNHLVNPFSFSTVSKSWGRTSVPNELVLH